MKMKNKDTIRNNVQIILLGKPEDISFVYHELGHDGDIAYYPPADLHHTAYGDFINLITFGNPFASQSMEFIEALANSQRELQFVTCRMAEDGNIAVRSLSNQEMAGFIYSVGFDPRQ